MPSFDMVSKIDMGEMKNALNQAEREITGRYDFKGSDTSLELTENAIELKTEDEYKAGAALEILRGKMAKRNIGQKCIEPGDLEPSGNQRVKQTIKLKNGIDKETGKKINKLIKESKIKVSSAYMDEKIRVTGKKIDDLQEVFQFVKGQMDIELQMENMKR